MPCQGGALRLIGHEPVSAVGRDKVLVQMADGLFSLWEAGHMSP